MRRSVACFPRFSGRRAHISDSGSGCRKGAKVNAQYGEGRTPLETRSRLLSAFAATRLGARVTAREVGPEEVVVVAIKLPS